MKYEYTFFLREYVPGTRMATLCSVSPPVKTNKYRANGFFDGKIVLKTVLIFKNLLSNSLSICTFPAYELDYVVSYNDLVSELPCLYIGQYILIFYQFKSLFVVY